MFVHENRVWLKEELYTGVWMGGWMTGECVGGWTDKRMDDLRNLDPFFAWFGIRLPGFEPQESKKEWVWASHPHN